VRPTRVYGPGPLHDANGVTKMLHLYLRGRFRVRLDDGDALANYVHADDVARGVLLAARRGARGGVYTLGGENASLRGFLALASELSGVRRTVLKLPSWAGYVIGAAAEMSALAGATPFITREWVRTFLEDWRVDIEDARRDLGYEPRTLRAGLAETIAWLRGTGAVPA
jgi:farnesol dehydrogenase